MYWIFNAFAASCSVKTEVAFAIENQDVNKKNIIIARPTNMLIKPPSVLSDRLIALDPQFVLSCNSDGRRVGKPLLNYIPVNIGEKRLNVFVSLAWSVVQQIGVLPYIHD